MFLFLREKLRLRLLKSESKMMRKFFRVAVFILLIYSCNSSLLPKEQELFALQLNTVDDKTFNLSEIKHNSASAFIFLSPECPLSQKYSLSIKNIYTRYLDKKIAVYLVFPGKLYNKNEINFFLSEYNLQFVSIEDEDKKLTSCLGAAITPEAFLIDSAGRILYKGAIDNWFIDIGQKREVITAHYLDDAIQSFLSGRPVKISQTKAAGCIIE